MTPSTSTGFLPCFLMWGREPRTPTEVALGLTDTSKYKDYSQFANTLITQLREAFSQVKENRQKAQQNQAHQYNKTTNERNWKKGELVAFKVTVVEEGKSKKLARPWKGPYEITEIIGKENLRIKSLNNKQEEHRVHVNRVKPWIGEYHPSEHPEEYEIETIKDSKETEDGTSYLVKWKNFTNKYNEWVPKDKLHADDLLRQFEIKKNASKNAKPKYLRRSPNNQTPIIRTRSGRTTSQPTRLKD